MGGRSRLCRVTALFALLCSCTPPAVVIDPRPRHEPSRTRKADAAMLFLQLLCCCCLRPPPDESDEVIPNERTRLVDESIAPAQPGPVVDRETLEERFGGIVRAKEGRMVSVSARAPFDMHDDDDNDTRSSDGPAPPLPSTNDGPTGVLLHRRPPVLTMTPARARSQGSFSRFSDSRTSSRSSSRAPPPRTPASASGSGAGSGAGAPVRERNGLGLGASEWFAASESGSSAGIEEEPEPSPSPSPSPPDHGLRQPTSTPVAAAAAPIAALAAAHPVVTPPPPHQVTPPPPHDLTPRAEGLPPTGITFDWDDL
ncbi:hypothetical protein MIND_00935200 [Mycena indigotica]|uniref:Uncharacterized protein n=1 Tax=Mycena indigotica TaxID=2126181 RepID=A0A8H6SES5_9AGAR|nr:uncharacterized protein MIND_00935200 [Mycena indigotica]KAF7297027.1 hypothetical protein MIND_00935200 [Mycena indigotica]